MSHLDEGVIHELLDGEIPSSLLGPIQAHLAGCAECRAKLDRERALLAGVDDLIDLLDVPGPTTEPAPVRSVSPSGRRWVRDLAWAATIVIAAGVGYAAHPPGAPAALPNTAGAPTTTSAIAAPPPTMHAPAVVAGSPSSAKPKDAAGPAPATPAVPKPVAAAPATSAEPLGGAAVERRIEAAAQSRGTVANDNPGFAPAAAKEARSLDATARSDGAMGNRLAQTADKASGRIDTISLPDAMRQLGGTLRLIDGLVPLRLELQQPYVRVVYPDSVVLQQQLVDGRIVFNVIAPRRFSTDSLTRLRAKVRE